MYKGELENMTTPMMLLIPTYEKVKGKNVKNYPTSGPTFFASYKTFGGSENRSNDVWVIEDTAVLTTFYRPDITSDCMVVRLQDNRKFEIINEPENVDMRNQYLKFKIKRKSGTM